MDGWSLDDAGRAVLKLRVAAAAADGAANAAVVALLAKTLGVSRSCVRIAQGQTARVKRLELEGVADEDVARAFGPPPA